jgi:hypothetical protein
MPAAGAEMLGTLQSNLADVFRAQPLALGAIGVAIGAGIAAALPSSELEAAYLGKTSDRVKGNAAELPASFDVTKRRSAFSILGLAQSRESLALRLRARLLGRREVQLERRALRGWPRFVPSAFAHGSSAEVGVPI